MKLKSSFFILSVVCAFAITSQALPGIYGTGALSCSETNNNITVRGGPVIWPWGSEISINLVGIQGVWKMNSEFCSDMYIVKVLKESPNESMVAITQYDPITCRTLAKGKGYVQNRVIRALMAGGGRSFEITIHAFRMSDIRPARTAADAFTNVYVMRKYAIAGGGVPQHLTSQISRLDKNPSMVCE